MIVAIMGGGDWNDAYVCHIVVPDGTDLDSEKRLYEEWYKTEYCGAGKASRIPFMTFPEWLKSRGSRDTSDSEVVEFWEDGPV